MGFMGVKKRKSKKLKINGKKMVAAIFVFMVLGVFGRNVVFMVANTNKFALVQNGTISRTIEAEGIILREEHVSIAPVSGMVSYAFRDGERVRVGSRIASVFAGEIDETIQIRLDRVNERIAEYQSSSIRMAHFAGSTQMAEAQVLDSVRDIITATYEGNMDAIPVLKNRIYTLNERQSPGEQDRALAALIAERDGLEQSIGDARNDIHSAHAGLFISRLDGYEGIMDVASRNRLLPSDLDVDFGARPQGARYVAKGEPIGKIINNFEWHFATVIDVRLARNLRVGTGVTVRFPTVSMNSIGATISSINDEEENEVVIVLTFNEHLENVHFSRKLRAEITLESFRGLQVHRSAIRVIDGVQGVFVVIDDRAYFRRVEVLQFNDSFAVVRDARDERNQLRLFDEIVIEGRNVMEGSVVR
jgi:putative membrane fusion protein